MEAEQQLKAQGIDTEFFDDRLREVMRAVVKAASLNVRDLPANPPLTSIFPVEGACSGIVRSAVSLHISHPLGQSHRTTTW